MFLSMSESCECYNHSYYSFTGLIVKNLKWEYETPEGVTIGEPSPMVIEATAKIAKDSRPLDGDGLWQLSLFGSRYEDGTGLQFNFVEQLLDISDESTPAGPDLPLQFSDLARRYDISSIGCGQFPYLCLQLQKGRNPMPDYLFRTSLGDDRIRSCKEVDCISSKYENIYTDFIIINILCIIAAVYTNDFHYVQY